MMRWITRIAVVGITVGFSAPAGASAQQGSSDPLTRLSLAQATQLAAEAAGPRAARARMNAAGLRRDATSARGLPTLGLEAGAVGSNDPVAVFGTRLRQQRFSQADFALDALNQPDVIGDLSGGAGASWTLFDQGFRREVSAAEADFESAVAMRQRTEEGAVLQVRLLYVEALRAEATFQATEAGLQAATALMSQVESRIEQGVAIEADRLRVEADRAALQAAQAGASAERESARERLMALLGLPSDPTIELTDGLAEIRNGLSSEVGALVAYDATDRADIQAARASLSAARARIDAVSAQRLPVVEAFAQLGVHSWSGNTGTAWTGGVRLSLPVFTGGAIRLQTESAAAMGRAEAIELDQRIRDASAEVREAHLRHQAAEAAYSASAAGVAAASEAARLLASRFREGLTTLSEVLLTEAALVNARRDHVNRESAVAATRAYLLFVTGNTAASNTNTSRNDR